MHRADGVGCVRGFAGPMKAVRRQRITRRRRPRKTTLRCALNAQRSTDLGDPQRPTHARQRRVRGANGKERSRLKTLPPPYVVAGATPSDLAVPCPPLKDVPLRCRGRATTASHLVHGYGAASRRFVGIHLLGLLPVGSTLGYPRSGASCMSRAANLRPLQERAILLPAWYMHKDQTQTDTCYLAHQ